MTEEIIIDGVDVAGCEYALTPKKQCPVKPMYYAKETSCIACKEHNTKLNFCKNNPNCYYKQLKRLKQENEELKALNEKICEDCSEQIKYYWKVFEEIRALCIHSRFIVTDLIQDKINEVLNDKEL